MINLKILNIAIIPIFFINCILDPFYTAKDKNSKSEITRSEAKDQIIIAATLKISLCGESSSRAILGKIISTMGDDKCRENTSLPFINKSKNLRSCDNEYDYVSKGNVETCISEIILSLCETTTSENYGLGYGYTACSSMLNTRNSIIGL
ncbi:hypothetical protein [Leptospira noguchii]|uniref:hypothetical protein n=1 Tax=Leptospira noguchii TaxID=28182 RepID=UPI000698A3BE|nr:hypothetical protein [Leptospira noguchii]